MDSSLVFLNTPYIVGKVLKSTKKRDNFQALEFKQLRNHLPKIFCAKSVSKRRNFECKKMRGSIFTTEKNFFSPSLNHSKKIKAPNFLGALTAEEGGEI